MSRTVKEICEKHIEVLRDETYLDEKGVRWVAREIVAKKLADNKEKIKFNNNCKLDKYTMETIFGLAFINSEEPNTSLSSLNLFIKVV